MRKSFMRLSAAVLICISGVATTGVAATGRALADDLMLDTPPATGGATGAPLETGAGGVQPLAPPAVLAPVPAQPPVEPKAQVAPGSWWSKLHLPHFDFAAPKQNWSTARPHSGMPMASSKALGYDPELNLSEADAAGQFSAMDHNHDGRLSFEEFSSLYASYYPANEDRSQPSKRFAALDADGDGFVTLKEYIANRNTEYSENSTMHWTANGARGPND